MSVTATHTRSGGVGSRSNWVQFHGAWIPAWLVEKATNPPPPGTGLHGWLWSVARQLHAHFSAPVIIEILAGATALLDVKPDRRRALVKEISDAVYNSHGKAWRRRPKGEVAASPTVQKSVRNSIGPDVENPITDRWPEFDPVAQRCRIAEVGAEGVAELYDLWERSPVRLDESHNWTADDWIDWLFPDGQWLCLAKDHPATARSRKREKWYFGPADECALVVPSPMTGPSGIGLDGKRTHRCLDNTGPRKWLVIEFDPKGWEALSLAEQKRYRDKANYYRIKINEQARLHWHFRESALAAGWPPLRLVVHSGSKSAHGWYGPVQSEEIAHELMSYAVSLGADTHTWTRCQLVRLPGGRRKIEIDPSISLPDWGEPEEFTRLQVFYFDPEGITQ